MGFLEQVGGIAREAGLLVRRMEGGRGLHIEEKGSSYDFVTAADTGSQQLICERVKTLFPGDRVVGEEDNLPDAAVMEVVRGAKGRVWVVDPLDGTMNYIRGLGGYAVSVGVFEDGEVIAGAIYLPESDELLLAELGGGATLNGQPIRVAGHARLKDAIAATHVPVSDMDLRRRSNHWNATASMECLNLRMLGSSARTQAKVAAGGVDFYYEFGPHPWDVAAGCLIVREAGGVASRLDGGPFDFGLGGVLISSKAIHAEAVAMLKRAGAH